VSVGVGDRIIDDARGESPHYGGCRASQGSVLMDVDQRGSSETSGWGDGNSILYREAGSKDCSEDQESEVTLC